MRKLTMVASLALGAGLLTGCPRPVQPPAPAPVPVPAPTPAPSVDTRGAAVYQVSPADSEVLIYVYRGGTLSRLGHNHVVSARELSGRVWLHPTFTRSGFELAFPVAQLSVDETARRSAAGPDFASEVSPSDKEGTRKNMLRAEVLNAERYPQIALRSAKIAGNAKAPQITAHITIRDATRDVDVPTKLELEGDRLRASGEFDVKQTDFGIKPFSVGLGALEVQDRLHIKFNIVARKGA